MRQFATQRMFFEASPEFAFHGDPGMVSLDQLLLLAIERAMAPPVVHRRSVFQPMRIVVINPALFSQSNSDDEIHLEMPNVLPRALPPVAVTNQTAPQFHQRTVRGEILSDESGRLYEKLGRQIRPIHQLASGQFGEVIDLVPTGPTTNRMLPPGATKKANENIKVTEPPAEAKSSSVETNNKSSSNKPDGFPIRETQSPHPELVTHRKLFADPGQWRVVWWGEFKEILARQLAHPERLRDSYRLPCYVQVLETERAVSIAELAAGYQSENENHARLYLLTDEIATKLDLVLPLRPAPPLHTQRQPNTLLAHERVFRLLVANDPTLDVAAVKSGMSSSKNTEVSTNVAITKSNEPAVPGVALKETIPAQFVKEWEFKITREEAVYDMNQKLTLSALLLNFMRRLRFSKIKTELRKWQALLNGKDPDEQLWAVRPPVGTLASQETRDWAAKTLRLGGYSEKMIFEWEIFWRRKGL